MTARGVRFEAINYLEKPLSTNELKRLLQAAGLTPKDALRTNEVAYQQHVAGQNLSDEQLVRVMAEHPELIQRPIVVRGNRVVLARTRGQAGRAWHKVTDCFIAAFGLPTICPEPTLYQTALFIIATNFCAIS